MSVHELLVELAETVEERYSVPGHPLGAQAYLDELLTIDAETRQRVDAAVEVIARGAHLPLLTGREYFCLQMRLIQTMSIPLMIDLPSSLLGCHIVPELSECGASPLHAVHWLLVDVWRAFAEHNIQEFAERAVAPRTQTPSEAAELSSSAVPSSLHQRLPE